MSDAAGDAPSEAEAPSESDGTGEPQPPKPPPPAQLGRRMRTLRHDQQLTISELARLSGVSKGYISQIERSDGIRPSAATLFAIARALGASAIELYEGPDAVAPPPVEIPDGLREFGEEADLPPSDIEMLARIHYRGAQPEEKEDWHFLYESIRRSVLTIP